MTCLQTSRTVVGTDLPWLEEVLACPSCRHSRSHCPHIETHFSRHNGIVSPLDPERASFVGEQQKVWESLAKARGTYDLPDDRLVLLPEDADARAQLDWLRTLLRGKGRLRILQLNARQGWAARALAEDGHMVVAADVLEDAHIGLGCAVRLSELSGPDFACVCGGPTALPFGSEVFDCVFGFDALRHIPDMERAFREVSRVLRPNGMFLALQEPFRGVLTTQTQRLLDTPCYRLARWWLPGKMSRSADPQIIHLRSQLSATVHDARRRVPFYLAQSEAAGLRTTILPTAVALALPPDLDPLQAVGAEEPGWLDAMARAYGLDIDRLCALVELAKPTLGYDLLPELLSHWTLVGNIDGILLARKRNQNLPSLPESLSRDAERSRRLDPLLLACAPGGFLPIYGVYSMQDEDQARYCWIQPQAGLIVPATNSLELTIGCPPKPLCMGGARIEFRLETERLPLAVVWVGPGREVTLKLPIPATAIRHASLFVGITTNFGFLPSDFNSAPGCDTRLLAVQLRSIRTGHVPDPVLATVLEQAKLI